MCVFACVSLKDTHANTENKTLPLPDLWLLLGRELLLCQVLLHGGGLLYALLDGLQRHGLAWVHLWVLASLCKTKVSSSFKH